MLIYCRGILPRNIVVIAEDPSNRRVRGKESTQRRADKNFLGRNHVILVVNEAAVEAKFDSRSNWCWRQSPR